MKNIVVTGFMGTGKTVVGKAIAQRLGRPFIDMDSAIEQWAGKPIPRVFAEDGEDRFRQMEAALCEKLSERMKGSGFLKTLLLRRVGSSINAGMKTAQRMLAEWEDVDDEAEEYEEDELFDNAAVQSTDSR